MDTKGKHFHRILLAGYFGVLCLFLLVYFLSGYLPAEQASLSKLLQDLFLNLSIALTISFGYYFLLRPLLEDRDRKNLEDFQKAALDLLTLEKGVREAGVVRIYESLADVGLMDRLTKVQNRLWFLSIWIDQPEKLLAEVLEHPEKQNLHVKILLAHPESDICKLRAESQAELFPYISSYEPEFITKILQNNNAYFKEIRSKIGEGLEVRAFDKLPPFSLVLVDDTALIGLYGYGEKTTAVPWIEFKLEGEGNEFSYFRTFILNQFETLWNHSQQIV